MTIGAEKDNPKGSVNNINHQSFYNHISGNNTNSSNSSSSNKLAVTATAAAATNWQ